MYMNEYQKSELRKFISENTQLIRNRNFYKLYSKLEKVDEENIYMKDWITYCFTEMMFKIDENPFEGILCIPPCAAMNNSIEKLIIPDSVEIIDNNAFENCELLESVKFSNNLKIIGFRAFNNCNSLKNLELPNSVEKIKEDAFSKCYNLESIKLGKNIKELETGIFYECTSLKDIYYSGTMDDWMQLDNCWPDSLDMPKNCILHCSNGDYIWDNKKQGWVER